MAIGTGAKARIQTLVQQLDINLELSEALNAFLAEGLLGCESEVFDQDCQTLNVPRSDYYGKRLLLELGLDETEAEGVLSSGLLKVRELAAADYESDPFIARLGKLALRRGRYALARESFQPLEGFLLTDVISGSKEENYATRTTLGYFSQGYSFPVLLSGKRIWMSGTPYEVETMRGFLNRAHGRVLTLGLGLGYFACSALLRDGVTSVTAVESAPEVIDLFQQGIRPAMDGGQGLTIVRGDAFAYLEEHGREFDYIFADLWHDEIDGLPMYVRLARIARSHNLQLDCWIEPSILTYLRECAIQALSLLAEKVQPTPEDGPVVRALVGYLRGKNLVSAGDVDRLLTDEALRLCASELRI